MCKWFNSIQVYHIECIQSVLPSWLLYWLDTLILLVACLPWRLVQPLPPNPVSTEQETSWIHCQTPYIVWGEGHGAIALEEMTIYRRWDGFACLKRCKISKLEHNHTDACLAWSGDPTNTPQTHSHGIWCVGKKINPLKIKIFFFYFLYMKRKWPTPPKPIHMVCGVMLVKG